MNTHRALRCGAGSDFLGCHSHKFNLAVKHVVDGYSTVVDKVQYLMQRLSYQIPVANLRQITPLHTLSNET